MDKFLGNWNYPTLIKFGTNITNNIANECNNLNLNNPLIVTDEFLINDTLVKNIINKIEENELHYGCFYNIKSNPTKKNIMDGVEVFNKGKHDSVICIGGGSALDAGKAIAFMSCQKLDIWEFEDVGDNYKKANPNIPKIIAIPTTAGTGSEVGRASVILDEVTKDKKIIFHPKMLPSLVLADPMLTVNLPKHLTAATGMDALIHNLEAYLAPGFHPLADGIALNGIKLIKDSLVRAYNNGPDINARANMLAASIMGATAFQKGLGAIHSLSHAIGAMYDKHHGLLNAIVAPYILNFNKGEINDKIIFLSKFLDLHKNDFIEWILSLRETLNIPNTLQEIGVNHKDVNLIAEKALKDPSTSTNPKTIYLDNFKELFLQAVG